MTQANDILRSNTSKLNVTLDSRQQQAATMAMIDFAARKVNEYRQSERKEINLEAVKLFPALLVGDWKLWLRKRAFRKACKQAKVRAEIENRKMYIIRSTEIAYIILSTLEVEQNKKVRVFGKNVDAIKLHETADKVVYPPKRK